MLVFFFYNAANMWPPTRVHSVTESNGATRDFKRGHFKLEVWRLLMAT